jgi:hypothetical protein
MRVCPSLRYFALSEKLQAAAESCQVQGRQCGHALFRPLRLTQSCLLQNTSHVAAVSAFLPGGKAANTYGTVARMELHVAAVRRQVCQTANQLPWFECAFPKSEDVLLQQSAGLEERRLARDANKILHDPALAPSPNSGGPPVQSEQTRDGPVQHPPAKILRCWLMALGR